MPHIVKSYDQKLKSLRKILYQQALLADKQLNKAFQALKEQNQELAEKVVSIDRDINKMHTEVRYLSTEIIALRQPLAYDLRLVISAISISSNIERIGDVAKNFTRNFKSFKVDVYGEDLLERVEGLLKMASQMHLEVLECLKSKGAEEALAVWRKDDHIDKQYHSLFQEILSKGSEVDDFNAIVKLLFVLKGIERIGDHATNIAEDIFYIFKGTDLLETQFPKQGRTEPKPDRYQM